MSDVDTGGAAPTPVAPRNAELAGANRLDLPLDRPPPHVRTFASARVPLHLDGAALCSAERLARRLGIDVDSVLLAPFALLLARYSGRHMVVIGVALDRLAGPADDPAGARDHSLLLPVEVGGVDTVDALLRRLHETCLAVGPAVERRDVARDTSRPPVSQVGFSARREPEPGLAPRPSSRGAWGGTTNELELGLVLGSGGCHGWLAYSTELFETNTARRVAGHYRNLLQGMLDAPEAPLTRLPTLTAHERRRVAQWNETSRGPRPARRLEELFLKRAGASPEAVAIISKGRRLSYGELELRSRAVAADLLRASVRPNTLVAVVMERGWEQVVAVLGILRAGAAYLPLEPDWPRDRLWQVLAQGECAVALTQGHVDAAIEWPAHLTRLVVGDAGVERPEDVPLLPATDFPADDIAYVIFTSGSTGVPKGVVIRHPAALNTILDVNDRFGVGPADRVLALSALSFDLSVWDIFGLLAAGASIVMPGADERGDPARWAEWVRAESVTIWNSVPSLLDLLVDHAEEEPADLASLRLVMLSGDWIPVTLPDRFHALAPDARVISLGGATEGAIWSIFHPVDEVDASWRSIPYGRPLANQTIHLLDQHMHAVPPGVAADLFIGGAGVADGYWRDKERTDASFVRHPLSGERLYRTGDLGRYRPDGVVEFLGRADHQVKVRGFRVELEEIEGALVRHASVADCVVAAVDDGTDRRLVGYVVPTGSGATVGELRRHLATKLPDYMVPTTFVMLAALPVTPNGKVDRRALPAPAGQRPGLGDDCVPPSTPGERVLAAIWTEILGIDRVGIHDNFFELGGDSVRSMQVAARARRQGIDITPLHVFEQPTIAALAAVAGPRSGAGEPTGGAGSDAVSPPARRGRRSSDGRPSPADFPLARVSRAELDEIIATLAPTERAPDA